MIVLQISSDSDNVNMRPTKNKKTWVTDSDMESENETHGAREDFRSVLVYLLNVINSKALVI